MLSRLAANTYLWIFLSAVLVAGVFAVVTDHAWEDYYITYRASKNLATGNGLVFNVGERLHTFTSPLGVLLPAVASLMTFNRSDEAALWIFRVMSSLALGGAVVLLYAALKQIRATGFIAFICVAAIATDVKSVDFTINGMETGFMLLFLAYTFWAGVVPDPGGRWKHLGLAWGGLMWTRPDSFIYIGLLAAGCFLFNDRARTGLTRREWIGQFLRAGLLCTAIYLPWFLTAWAYYGSPVPHTIVAKSSVATNARTLGGVLNTLVRMPIETWHLATPQSAFLPSYFAAGGWPKLLVVIAKCAAFLSAFLWLLPRVRCEARVASFAFLGAHVYLTYFPYYPFPWYVPPTTFLAFAALVGVAADLLAKRDLGRLPRWAPALWIVPLAFLLASQTWTLYAAGRQIRAMQQHIETGNRRLMGEWLAKNAEPTDTVFLEPLGYVGFFSNLKIYDWPGLSSKEVVEAHKKVGPSWAYIVENLAPNWLILRPPEAELMRQTKPYVLNHLYSPVKEFDVRDKVAGDNVYGRRLLEMDAHFTVFKRNVGMRIITDAGEVTSLYPGPVTVATIDNVVMRLVHAPGSISMAIPSGARHIRVSFALPEAAYEADPKTDGATFQTIWVLGDREQILFERTLDPAQNAGDRGAITMEAELPEDATQRAKIVLKSIPGKTDTKDWTCWGNVEFW